MSLLLTFPNSFYLFILHIVSIQIDSDPYFIMSTKFETTSEYIAFVIQRAIPSTIYNLTKSAADLVDSQVIPDPDVYLALQQSEEFVQQYCYKQWYNEWEYHWRGAATEPDHCDEPNAQVGANEDYIFYNRQVSDSILNNLETTQLVNHILDLLESESKTSNNRWHDNFKKFYLQGDDEDINLVTSHCDFYYTAASVEDCE
ncbi:19693_t:CDS:2, partial [Racocetra fulgida]